jgi:hypothetical protein
VYHIVEEPGRVDLMAEELPTDYYYEKIRERLTKKFPEASVHVLDHLEALEAFLDKSICAGFSFGVEKAAVGVTEGKLLGHLVGRFGLRSDDEKVKMIMGFPPQREAAHSTVFGLHKLSSLVSPATVWLCSEEARRVPERNNPVSYRRLGPWGLGW